MSKRQPNPSSPVAGTDDCRSGAQGDNPPITVTDHTLIRCIGRGAYGEVWLARNALGSLRAVKVVLRRAFIDDRPFEREFLGIQRFEPISRSHETQLNILHVGRTTGGFYYVMELADAVPDDAGPSACEPHWIDPNELANLVGYVPHTLRSELRRRGRLPLCECLQVGLALTAALEHLHQRGLVHRDIKPSNIVFIRGKPKLADIGLVSGVEEAKSFVGTEGYIPPEGPGSAQADLYSLGKVLYELATGKDRSEFPQLPDDFRGSPDGALFADLNEILLRACATEPSNRYRTAEEMRTELLLLEAGRSIRGLRADEVLLRRLKLAAVIGLSCLIVVAGFALYQRQRAAARAEQLLALKEKEAQRRQTAYAADMAIAFQGWEAGRAELSRELLDAQRPGAEEDLRGWEWRYLWAQTRREESRRLTTTCSFGLWSCAFAPNGMEAAGGTVDGQVICWNLQSGRNVAVLGRPDVYDPVDSVAFSPDGALIYQSLRNSGMVVVWDRATQKEIRRFGTGKRGVKFALSPDGTRAATVSGPDYAPEGPGELVLWDAGSSRELARSATQPTWLIRVTFSPDGRHVATSGGRGHAKVWSVPDLREVAALPHEAQTTLFALAFSPNGRRLVTGANDGLLRIWDWAKGRLEGTWMGHTFGCDAAQWSPDGAWLATGGRDQVVRLWEAKNRLNLAAMKGHHGRVTSLAVSPDGKSLISASEDKTLRSWSVADWVQPSQIQSLDGFPFDAEISLSSDSHWLALAGESNQVKVVSLPRLEPVGTVTGRTPVFSPAGHWLVTVVSNRLQMFNMPEGRAERTFAGQGALSGRPAFSARGDLLAMASADGTVFVWRVTQSEPMLKITAGGPLRGLFFASEGRELVTLLGADGTLEWRNCLTGRRMRLLRTGEGSVTSAALSPDGTTVLVGETAARMRLVNLRTGRVDLLKADAGSVMSVGWSADGQTVVAGTFEGFIKLWNARTRREMATLRGHTSIVTAAVFSRDGRLLVSASYDKTWRLWSAPTMDETGANLGTPFHLSR